MCCAIAQDTQTLRVWSKKGKRNNHQSSWLFQLNGVLHNASQEDIYDGVARSVVLGTFGGYNGWSFKCIHIISEITNIYRGSFYFEIKCLGKPFVCLGTIMCFGQTGAGKTYTMTGAAETYKQRGIIPRALQEVFQEVVDRVDHTFSVHLSFLEIYNETIVDLLSSLKHGKGSHSGVLTVVEEPGGGVSVKGLSLHLVHNEEEALNLLFEGEMNRIIGEHALNKHSSRSHCIFTVHIESRSRTLSEAKYITSKLNLVDLAGSERLSKTGSEGQVQMEAMYINKSLSFLEQVILALADSRREHVPFRQCKLTHALKDSLGGNCNTVLVANIYGEGAQIEETLSTLRFATRMKCVKTKPLINEHVDPVLQVQRLEKEIQFLKEELSMCNKLTNRVSNEILSETQVEEVRSQVQRYLSGSLVEIPIVSITQIQEVFAQFKKVVLEQQTKLREQLCPRNARVEKAMNTTPFTVAEAQGSICAVGKVESCGYGLGLAKSSQRHQREVSPKPSKARKDKQISRKEGALSQWPVENTTVEAAQPLNMSESDMTTQEPQRQDPEQQHRTDSPPPKAEAFEDFKAQRGSEINRILKENKAVLLDRTSQLRTLTDVINVTKRDLDNITYELQQFRERRQSQGQFVSAEGEPVMEEAELSLLMQLKELKNRYRQAYEDLRCTKTEVSYCQHLVNQCRTRLLTEFESWYNESFLLPDEVLSVLEAGPVRPGHIPVDKALALMEDDEEHCDAPCHKLQADSSSAVSFYNAYNRTLQRRGSRQASQSPDSVRGSRSKIKLCSILSIIR
ncbi:kinesin-like protein KIF9 isoform X3 [Rhinichthys klamathensis goyatoka]|uniref:kinesin-like protein KIF9 isoform X3 n=1 Tax=Rhinichthys klamathensis goyatoka TaxID=3034132 RepID=UPI0024B55511|nr:kinesin-like protein KIF9 isoform X3 [Rhinichthys klamathensis goyatoka]